MNVISRLREKIKPTKQYADPFGKYHRSITWCWDQECWNELPKERKDQIIGWAKQNLWKDDLAYWVLRRLEEGEIKA